MLFDYTVNNIQIYIVMDIVVMCAHVWELRNCSPIKF